MTVIGAVFFGVAILIATPGDPPRWAFAFLTGLVATGLTIVTVYARRRE